MKSIFYLLLVFSKSEAGIINLPPNRKPGTIECQPPEIYEIGEFIQGAVATLVDPCIRVTCNNDYSMEIATCGTVSVGKNCRILRPPFQTYPMCCPQKVVCKKTPINNRNKGR